MTEITDYSGKNSEFLERLPEVVEALRPRFVFIARSKYGITGQDAMDVVQETYVSLTKTLRSERDFVEFNNGLEGLAFVAFNNACADHYDYKNAKKRKGQIVDIYEMELGGDKTPLDILEERESLDLVMYHLESLTPKYRETIETHLAETYRGNASVAHRSMLMRARKMLKQSIAHSEKSDENLEID